MTHDLDEIVSQFKKKDEIVPSSYTQSDSLKSKSFHDSIIRIFWITTCIQLLR
jgi:hypothetical protein